MAVTPTYPGVYVQEIPSGVRSIAGVSTSIGLFIGRTSKGPLNQAVRLFSYTDFERTFSSDTSVSAMADHVRLFFLNGGTDCYVMRIANGATFAQTTLLAEDGVTEVLQLTAKFPGAIGNSIRAVVSYGGANPETTFNLDLFREEVDAGGRISILEAETYKNLSMNPVAALYAPEVVNTNSSLVRAAVPAPLPATNPGFSLSGQPVVYDSGDLTTLRDMWANRLGNASIGGNRFMISVDGQPVIPINLNGVDIAGIAAPTAANIAQAIEDEINNLLAAAGQAGTTVTVTLDDANDVPNVVTGAVLDAGIAGTADSASVLKIASNVASGASVVITPSATNDLSVPLRLGAGQGGIEVSAYSAHRPAPNGISLQAADQTVLRDLGDLQHNQILALRLSAFDSAGAPAIATVPVNLLAEGGALATTPLWLNSLGGLRTILQRLADAVNTYRNANPLTFFWSASVAGNRLTLTTSRGTANTVSATFASDPVAQDIGPFFNVNTRYYSIGEGALVTTFQTPTPAVDTNGAAAPSVTDGTAPTLQDYTNAFPLVEKDADIFNIMVLPEDADAAAVDLSLVYGPASVFCQQQRAFLVMEAPKAWKTAQDASTKVANLRVGLVKDHSALYFPRLLISDGKKTKALGAAGAVAGVYARIDNTRGVWKAPAGVEADLRGIVGLEHRFTDGEHGAMNPQGVNVLRPFPNGLVIYGARTNDGADDFASEYKYIPIRRLALYIEESLYRGLKWVVFEPNDDPLYGQIRLNVGVFMHDLYRRGAFQGPKPSDAYFVKCDRETTTQSDRNLGIVNIIVGFAPLKPAEFVILYLQQMAGQLQV
ncbi:phage tail sheath family protein [Desulfobacca acetoxidans]|uniref:Phage tail sheath protein n=1 Tax=Desulfobacca acetoxidans (strain ATCC 700848 / DSM 11109 / ASRB2) TaxID=880072 RepID=F2NI16_DESAR|nr:phage tail sheath subtilisin-like domain-containing protein [Desulfobacca acetoxidans]AEB09642.1 phage tail sheath protein [Desulfobacca acetoxidans DSM 11109]